MAVSRAAIMVPEVQLRLTTSLPPPLQNITLRPSNPINHPSQAETTSRSALLRVPIQRAFVPRDTAALARSAAGISVLQSQPYDAPVAIDLPTMASSRRSQQPSLTIPTPFSTSPDLPPISALFLIDFDAKAGYTIVWKRAVDGVELDGRVEYKSLPSGLHTVSEDLIYFVHEGTHAGLSAFVNVPCEEEESRNARMIAVGVLVPLSYGRLGRAWRHAEDLKSMAAYVIQLYIQTPSWC